ncbi:MAG: endolytic transglycosylase MltG, partial [Pseudomonadota bacterium]
ARLHEGALLARVRDRVCYNTLGVESVANLEGLFAPETYAFTRRIAPDDLLVRAHERLCTQLQSLWQAHPNMFANAYEALILASIIEKETARDEDRSNVSQVFHNRLQRNMRLQTDPTVIYALGESFDGDIRRRDLQVDSPYNTYRVKGLPPTPIASVSLASLQAAFQPSDGTLLYFVARGDGTTQFSTTLEEHNAAVRRFQLGQSG